MRTTNGVARAAAFVSVSFITGAGLAASPYEPSPQDLARLGKLRPGHPRCLLTKERLAELRSLVRSDGGARTVCQSVRRRADRVLREKPVERKLIGPRLLDKSRRCLDRVTTLALTYLLDGDAKYLERAVREMRAAAAFRDWNPSHFLDTAEMTNALGLGYDWLFDSLSADDREVIRRAIVEKGLKPTAKCYKGKSWWPRSRYNWNQVCNGGGVVGALAVADAGEEERRLAAYVLGRAVESVPRAMASFAPDGGWAEGPGYWSYATRYNVFLLAALESALGTDYGLSRSPGFPVTGFFRMAAAGPTGFFFNYADCGARAGGASQAWWLARKFEEPAFAELARGAMGRGGRAFDLLWYVAEGTMPRARPAPLDYLFKGVDVAFFRSAWGDRDAVYVGFKGGDNKANHSHLDLGTFVLDSRGVRWAADLSGDNYNLPGYFGRERWTYYRLRTEGQNTITLDGENQETRAKAPIVAFHSPWRSGRKGSRVTLLDAQDAAFAVADLSAAYKSRARSVLRGVALLDRRDVLVQDELVLTKPAEIVWTMHTRAEVEADGRQAVLTRDGKRLLARLLLPKEGAGFAVEDAEGKGSPNKGVRKLVVRLNVTDAGGRALAVLFSPVPARPEPKRLEPLSAWITKGPPELSALEHVVQPPPTRPARAPEKPPAERRRATPEAVAARDAELLERIREEVANQVGESRRVRFSLHGFRQQFEVVSASGEGALKLRGPTTEVDMEWSRLTFADRRNLATAVLRMGLPEDHCLVAFYMLAEGDKRGAIAHLARGGEGGRAVEAAFVPVPEGEGGAPERGRKPDEARKPLRQAVRQPRPRERGPPLQELARLYRDAESAFIAGDIERAKELFRAISSDHPDTDCGQKAKEFLKILE